MGPSPPTPHERAAALLRRQQSTTARLRAGLPELLDQLEQMDEPVLADVEAFQLRPTGPGNDDGPAPAVDDDHGDAGTRR